MSDPLASATPGDVSPFVNRLDTVNQVLEAVRRVRKAERGSEGGVPELDAVTPAVVVYVRNDTGGDLAIRSVVKIGAPVVSAVTYPIDVQRQPVFEATAPAAGTDAFAVLDEPIADGAVGTAIVAGHAVCDLLVNDSGHGYAAPIAADTAKLGSATSGPAKIVHKYGSSGTQRAVVLLQGDMGSAGGITVEEVDGSPSYTSITTLQFDQADAFAISQPAPGIVRVELLDAGATSPGIVSTGAQEFSGDKTFLDPALFGSTVGVTGRLSANLGHFIANPTGDPIQGPDAEATAPASGSSSFPSMTEPFALFTSDGGTGAAYLVVTGEPDTAHGSDVWLIPYRSSSGAKAGRLIVPGRYAYYKATGSGTGTLYTGASGTLGDGTEINGGIVTTIGTDPFASESYVDSAVAALSTVYQPLDADLTSLAAASSTGVLYYRSAAGTWSVVTISTGLNFSGGTLTCTVTGGVTDHGALTGLSDDDHEQYTLLAGRSGGQTLSGGTGSGEGLVLKGTADASTGLVVVDAWLYLKEVSAPGAASGSVAVYPKTDRHLYTKDSLGTERRLTLPVELGTVTTGTWTATAIGVQYGGTGANLSATGGTGHVVKQASAGAAFTVGALAASELPAASDSAQGAIEIAVQSEMESGSDTTRAVTPGRQHLHPSAAKAWVVFTGNGSVSVLASYGISSVVRNSTGDFTINFTTSFSSANYAYSVVTGRNSAAVTGVFISAPDSASPTSSAFRFLVGNTTYSGVADPNYVSAVFYGDQ